MLTIYRYKGEFKNGRQVYGIRGMGRDYSRFYNVWYYNKKPVYTHEDFPWDYNAFAEEDEQDLIKIWGKFIEDIEIITANNE